MAIKVKVCAKAGGWGLKRQWFGFLWISVGYWAYVSKARAERVVAEVNRTGKIPEDWFIAGLPEVEDQWKQTRP